MKEIIQADMYRWTGKQKCTSIELIKLKFIPQFKLIYYKRKCEIYREKNKFFFAFYSLIYRHYKIKYSVDLPAKVKIGEGFLLEHIGGITINPNVTFGKNVNLYNGVTIGIEKRGKRKGVPTIGNRVWIGANSVIVGNISIGDDVLIAPSSFVNFDIPNHSIVIGNPAKIIHKKKATSEYISNLI